MPPSATACPSHVFPHRSAPLQRPRHCPPAAPRLLRGAVWHARPRLCRVPHRYALPLPHGASRDWRRKWAWASVLACRPGFSARRLILLLPLFLFTMVKDGVDPKKKPSLMQSVVKWYLTNHINRQFAGAGAVPACEICLFCCRHRSYNLITFLSPFSPLFVQVHGTSRTALRFRPAFPPQASPPCVTPAYQPCSVFFVSPPVCAGLATSTFSALVLNPHSHMNR